MSAPSKPHDIILPGPLNFLKTLHVRPFPRVNSTVSRSAFLAAVVVSAFAADPKLETLLQAVENRYNRAQTLEVSFSETYSAPGRPRKIESGNLYLRKPGRMRWQYSSPTGKLFVGDGKYLYLYTPSNNQVEKTKMKESEDMRAPLAFLLGKLHFDKDFQNFTARPEGAGTWVAAEPKSPNLPYTRVEFAVAPDARIRRVQVTGYDRSVLEFTFENEKLNPPLDAKLFEFRMPPGAGMVEASQ